LHDLIYYVADFLREVS